MRCNQVVLLFENSELLNQDARATTDVVCILIMSQLSSCYAVFIGTDKLRAKPNYSLGVNKPLRPVSCC
jgi:hypothetical protein